MSDTRVQAANLLCKIFLHYLVLLSEWDGMLDLWLRILDIMDRLMNSGQGDHLEEAVPESLKNILLVMADGGFIQPPVDGHPRTELWDETCKRVDRFLPDLIGDIFPKVNAPPPEPEPEIGKEPAAPEKETVREEEKEEHAEEKPASVDPQPQDVD
jgi:brefeldin A-resistance guanine nucleotide exchange factor 1